MVTLSERRDLWRSPGFELAGARAFDLVGRGPAEIDHFELYSCFPAAVRIQQRELGIPLDRRVTQTGGMTFGGGPLNNFVVQAWVKMIERMRSDPGSHGAVTAISGLITKQGVSVLAPEPSEPFVYETVTEAAKASSPTISVEREAVGHARISSYTVSHARDAANGVALVCDFPDARRTLRVVSDPELMERGEREELIGREVELLANGGLRWV